MSSSIPGLLITVRTGKQGAAMEKGKFTKEFLQEISTLTVNPEDFAALGLHQDNKAILRNSTEKITVTCRSKEGPRGLFFLPLGPLANRLIDEETYGTGVPNFKGIPVTLTAEDANMQEADKKEEKK